jgi:hypothetical protein
MTNKYLRAWFECNYLDGDSIQKGQMISSKECWDAVISAVSLVEGDILRKLDKINTDGGGNGRRILEQVKNIIKGYDQKNN